MKSVGQLSESQREALSLRRNGMTYAQIASRLGLSSSYVAAMLKRATRIDAAAKSDPDHNAAQYLGTRAANCLLAEYGINIASPDAAKKAAKISLSELSQTPNLGKESIKQITAWLSANGLSAKD